MVALSVLGALMSVVVASSPGGTAGFGSAPRIPTGTPSPPPGTPATPLPVLSGLNSDLCSTYYRSGGYFPYFASALQRQSRLVDDCRTMVAWRNAVVNHPDSLIDATNPITQWGQGDELKFTDWTGLRFRWVNSRYRVVENINLTFRGLAGPLPGPLPYLEGLFLRDNSLSGEIPSWIYTSEHLKHIRIENNRLSGEVGAFSAPNLQYMFLNGNYFSGSLPTFNFARMSNLETIVLSDNSFSGPIPASWSAMADYNVRDGRLIYLDITNNQVSGTLPSWVSNIRFKESLSDSVGWRPQDYPYAVRMANNKLCIPENFEIPRYKKGRLEPPRWIGVQRYADAWLELEPQQCATSKTLISRAQNIHFEPVDAAGQPTTTNPVGLKVTWNKPSTMTGAVTYWVQLFLTADQGNPRGTQRYNTYCPGSVTNAIVGPDAAANLERTVTRSDCSVTDQRTIFDPTKYTVDVSVLLKNQQTTYVGPATFSNAWSVFTADNPQKTFQDVANIIRLPFQRSIWIWDATNQIWFERSQDQPNFATLNLQPGDSLAFQRTVPVSWLTPAGLSTADEDTPVQLQNGWNIISAGAVAARPQNNNGAYFIDSSLVVCACLLYTSPSPRD